MTHDQLVKVFPDGRTVHIPSDGVPLKGYELAKADIEKRGNGDATITKPPFLAALFKGGNSNDEDEEAAAMDEKPAPVALAAAAPRTRPQAAAALQFAAADAQLVQPPKAKPASVPADKAREANPDAKPETPADIINARGFWGDDGSPQRDSAAQVMAVAARRALEAADLQSTVSAPYDAMAYAPPAASATDRSNIAAASAPIPRSPQPVLARELNAATEINAIATKSAPGQGEVVTIATRLSAAKGNEIWLRMLLLTADISNSMSVTIMGDTDMTQMRTFFVKPQTAIAIRFSDDPTPGLASDHFSGAAVIKLETTSFALRTALLK
jgi:hypothetical protein